MPPNFGQIYIEDGDLDAARFWLRVFQLEPYVAVASADIRARGAEINRASVPILSEFVAGRLYFYYAILLFIDPLGLQGAIGLICFADEKNRERAKEKRDALGEQIMKGIGEQVAAGKMTGATLVIEPGKE